MGDNPYRWSVLSAVAWRVVAELYRRHAHEHELRIHHIHPGLSAWGILRLQDGVAGESERPHIDISLGGGDNGSVSVRPWREVETPPLERWQDRNIVRELIAARDPKSVVDDVAESAGLRVDQPVPASTPSVLAVRVIAEMLERRSLSRQTLRASSGFQDSADPIITTWARAAPTIHEPLGQVPHATLRECQLANRIWALHSSLEHEGPAGDDLPRGSVVFDLRDGSLWPASSPRERVALTALYEKHDRRLSDVVHEVEEMMRRGGGT